MKILYYLVLATGLIIAGCGETENISENTTSKAAEIKTPVLDINEAGRLILLPLACITKEYPNKPGVTLSGDEDIASPEDMHPAFFGCFDWHSSVHGHWSIIKILKEFPDIDDADKIASLMTDRISKANIHSEIEYFSKEHNKTFERTYGWAWLLKLAAELHSWDDPLARELENNLQPLTDLIADMFVDFLQKLHYPIRVGTHTNTAFALCFAWDYALAVGNDSLLLTIGETALNFYYHDTACPINWEPGGNDFLSPCFEEIDIMRRVLDEPEFLDWMAGFLPELADPDYDLEPGIVTDRTDGQLAHLDGLNFSRAWCLYNLANQYEEYSHLSRLADVHVNYSLADITDGNYEGGHWLGSFALLALDSIQDNR